MEKEGSKLVARSGETGNREMKLIRRLQMGLTEKYKCNSRPPVVHGTITSKSTRRFPSAGWKGRERDSLVGRRGVDRRDTVHSSASIQPPLLRRDTRGTRRTAEKMARKGATKVSKCQLERKSGSGKRDRSALTMMSSRQQQAGGRVQKWKEGRMTSELSLFVENPIRCSVNSPQHPTRQAQHGPQHPCLESEGE